MTLRTFHERVNMRARGMILVAWAWCMVGIGALYAPNPSEVTATWHLLIPPVLSMFLWSGTGLAAAILSLTKRHSSIGLGILMIAPLVRFTSYLTSWVIELVPGDPHGDPRGWFSAQFYLVMMFWVFYIAMSSADTDADIIVETEDTEEQ
jgi:hypothetical protein